MNIIQMLVPDQYVFPNSWGATRRWLILHKTAGFHTAQEVAAYFQAGAPQPDGTLAETSVHYVIGQDGLVVQCVSEHDGAGGNGILEPGHDSWWSGNPNLVTFSIEHVDPARDNSTPLTSAQQAASFQLIHDICTRWNIPMRPADEHGGITGHYSIDPESRKNCPGNYPWAELWPFLKGTEHMPVPQGWSDNGTKLVSPNGHYAVKGFRQHVIDAPDWDSTDQFLEEEQAAVSQVELHANSGPGSRQLTRLKLLIYTEAKGVKESAAGQEIAACYNMIAAQRQQNDAFKIQIATLKALPAGVDETALNAAQTQVIDLQRKIVNAQGALK